MFKKFIRPLIAMFIAIAIPAVVLTVVSNLPNPEPPIPSYYKAQGFSSLSGVQVESFLEAQSELKLGGQPALVACPATLIVGATTPGLCGYCKISDVVIYPFWQDGFTKKLTAANYDYRFFYVDALHTRFVSLRQSNARIFDQSKDDGKWRDSYGRWFKCQNADLLDVNAYVEVFKERTAANKLKVRFDVGNYDALGIVRDQIHVDAPKKG